jgi:phenylpropionate dioxygenase-like ring-hydroxylating dioxygenase large terminal subunit
MRADDTSADWYVAARSAQVGTKPIDRTVLGRRLVLFRDAAGAASAVDARCPHRGALLVHGRVVDGCIACPYHGWTFDRAGRCVRIPSQPPGKRVSDGFHTRAHEVREQQGFVWVCVADAPPLAPPPRFTLGTGPTFATEKRVPLPCDWWIENTLDMAHIPFVHQGTMGGEDAVLPIGYPVERRADHLGFTARTITRQRYSRLAALMHGQRYAEMRIDVEHHMPTTTVFRIEIAPGKIQHILFLATPETPSTTRTWMVFARTYLTWVPLGDLIGGWFARAVLREDERIGLRSIHDRGARQLSVAADEPALEYHRLVRYWLRHDGALRVPRS